MMLERLLADPTIEVVALLTTVSTAYDRISIHGVLRSILRKQADSIGVPLFEVAPGATSSNDDYDRQVLLARLDGPICRQPIDVTLGECVLREDRFQYGDLVD